MPANVQLNDFRWQFIAGDKYWIIGSIVFSGTYVVGGIPVLFQPLANPVPGNQALVKASRAPWFAVIPGDSSGNSYVYITPSQLNNINPPNTVGTSTGGTSDVNGGVLQMYNAGAQLAAGDALPTTPVSGLFIFQGME